MTKKLLSFFLVLFLASTCWAQQKNYTIAKVSFEDFKGIVAAVEPHRKERLIDLNTFLKMSQEPNAIILDSRSDFRYDRIHIKGAKHISFTDFTQASLEKVIPNSDMTILIYCNNNFEGNQTDFASKVYNPNSSNDKAMAKQMESQERPISLALNIPTYINLYGYGYRNIYELNELVNVTDPRIEFEGSIVQKKANPTEQLIEIKVPVATNAKVFQK